MGICRGGSRRAGACRCRRGRGEGTHCDSSSRAVPEGLPALPQLQILWGPLGWKHGVKSQLRHFLGSRFHTLQRSFTEEWEAPWRRNRKSQRWGGLMSAQGDGSPCVLGMDTVPPMC